MSQERTLASIGNAKAWCSRAAWKTSFRNNEALAVEPLGLATMPPGRTDKLSMKPWRVAIDEDLAGQLVHAIAQCGLGQVAVVDAGRHRGSMDGNRTRAHDSRLAPVMSVHIREVFRFD